jgi:Ca2+-binding RTX toxin-like protein
VTDYEEEIMPIFDYKGQDARQLVTQANDLMTYSYHGLDEGFASSYTRNGLGLGAPLTLIDGVLGILPGAISNTPDAEQHARDAIEDKGWTVLTKEQLNYADARVDKWGTFQGETALESSAQADILGRYDDQGNLVQIGIAFRGTTGPRDQLISDSLLDIVNDVSLLDPNYHYTDRAFATLLAKVATFASANGLTGEDVLVTGHSLGGAAVNDLAALSQDASKPAYQFYSNSNYIAQAAPRIYDDPNVVLNYGLENDPVFRVAADGVSLGVHDKPHASTTDNIVTFNDYYASSLFPLGVFSILNLTNWIDHLPSFAASSVNRIASSAFYGKMKQDSVIIVADLSDPQRKTTWVEDKPSPTATDHAGKQVFLLGTDKADLIKSHGTSDFLEGRGGDDRFILGGGQDVVLGGAGNDRVELTSSLSSYNFARTADGTIYVSEANGDGGFSTLSSVETIQTQENVKLFGIPTPFKKTVNQSVGSIAYAETREGGSGNDALTLANNASGWLWGREGNDNLTGNGGNDHLDGGAGNDNLWGRGGDDVFTFAGAFGNDVVHDFGTNDRLNFVGIEGFGNLADVLHSAHQSGSDVIINHGNDSVTLTGTNLSSLTANNILFA